MTSPIAVWRPVPGWMGLYEVSDRGDVRSLPREIPHYCGGVRRLPGRTLRPVIRRGYAQVMLRGDGRRTIEAIHRLVLTAFVGPCPPGQETLHRDGQRTNNALANLRWGTRTENALDKVRHGTDHNTAKLACPLGHQLAEPNLVASNLALGWRMCRACHQARAEVRDHPERQFETVAHERYRAIVGAC